MRSLTERVLLDTISKLDVNPIGDAIKKAEAESRRNPGLIFSEVDEAKREVERAITHLLRARRALMTAVGEAAARAEREAPQMKAAVA